jgi:hypothetical protein
MTSNSSANSDSADVWNTPAQRLAADSALEPALAYARDSGAVADSPPDPQEDDATDPPEVDPPF